MAWICRPWHTRRWEKAGDAFGFNIIKAGLLTVQIVVDNKKIARTPGSRSKAPVWQREYWDRFIRDQAHFDATRRYIETNPVNAGLVTRPGEWPWSSAGNGIRMESRD